MQSQRTLNSAYNIARDGSVPKNIPDAPVKPGMKRATSGEMAAYHHSQTVADEPSVPLKTYEQKIPVHTGMTDQQRAKIDQSNDAGAILRDAANLGRKA
jgi:hypothetical protein